MTGRSGMEARIGSRKGRPSAQYEGSAGGEASGLDLSQCDIRNASSTSALLRGWKRRALIWSVLVARSARCTDEPGKVKLAPLEFSAVVPLSENPLAA